MGNVSESVPARPGAEISTEANPESVDAAGLARLVELWFNRVSFGMQSAVPHVFAPSTGCIRPDGPAVAVAEAKAAGFAESASI